MKRFSQLPRSRHPESGYALLLIMFFLALLVLSAVAAAPTVLSSVQRERETEMVWRGHQYTRGIRMFYMKMQRFPTSLDDLTQPKTGLRFMRQAYKDPMNQVDGSWRLIYVGPNGQLIGSFMDHNIGMGGQFGQPVSGQAVGSSLFNTGGSLPMGSSPSSLNQGAGSAQGTAMGTASQNSSSSTALNAQNPDSSEDPGQPHSLTGSMDASNTIGGNIIGVGSKVNRKSFLWYEKAKNYRQFEFIWDPSKDTTIGGASVGIGTPVQNANGPNPSGTPNSPFSPGMNGNQNSIGNPSPNMNPPLQAPPPNQ